MPSGEMREYARRRGENDRREGDLAAMPRWREDRKMSIGCIAFMDGASAMCVTTRGAIMFERKQGAPVAGLGRSRSFYYLLVEM